jgi:uncharacterized repeat protein (TIGR03803 family)
MSLSGNETVRHSFGGSPDGAYRQGELINVHGLLYGTTVNGGSASRNGAIYTITTAGVEKVIYAFGSFPDGAGPYGDFRDVGGKRPHGENGRQPPAQGFIL